MKKAMLVVFGWLVPGGAYLLMRRYVQFAVFASAVTAAVIAGVALQGGSGWPRTRKSWPGWMDSRRWCSRRERL